MRFEVTILGSGSATPTLRRNPTAQVVNLQEQLFLIDCSEGTQLQLRRRRIKFQKINHIFISHLHGDHYLGLIGLISTMHLLGRQQKLHIYAPPDLKEIIDIQLKASDTELRFPVEFHFLTAEVPVKILENKVVEVHTIPLKHRIYCNGFLFRERPRARKVIKQKAKGAGLPIEAYQYIKDGKDFTDDKGNVWKFEDFTKPPPKTRSYAFCSDTAYHPPIADQIKGVDLLYHESTFLDAMAERATDTYHSTAKQAAMIAEKAEAGHLILGHFSARYREADEFQTEARTIFEDSEVAEDGMVCSIG